MLDTEPAEGAGVTPATDRVTEQPPTTTTTRRRRVTKAVSAAPAAAEPGPAAAEPGTAAPVEPASAEPAPVKKATRSRRKAAAPATGSTDSGSTDSGSTDAEGSSGNAEQPAPPVKKATRSRRKVAAPEVDAAATIVPATTAAVPPVTPAVPAVTFMPPPPPPPVPVGSPAATGPDGTGAAPPQRRRTVRTAVEPVVPSTEDAAEQPDADDDVDSERRRRRRGRRGRGRSRDLADDADATSGSDDADRSEDDESDSEDTEPAEPVDGDEPDRPSGATRRRRRRKRRVSAGGGEDASGDDPPNTVVHVRESRPAGDEVQSVRGSTRLEAKRQRRREGRETQRRRPPILSEAEFLARREAVDRTMVVRQRGDRTQIAVLEDDVLVEHYVTKSGSTSYAGNVYLGRVQNVLPSMEAAFVDIGKGRNAVLYAGEVNWDVAGLEGKARSIEQALKSGDSVLVQVTKDPIGHKGARLTSQISLPGRYLVYVPGGSMTGISRKLPDTERQRLKDILKRIVPDRAGVIIRTAAEGASEEELTRDVARLQAQWQVIQERAARGAAPVLLSEEPDLVIRVVRDIFNEDFNTLVVSGGEAWNTLHDYLSQVAPDLAPRLSKHTAETDVFADLRIDEQLMKALDRKVWLPSGGSLVIDRTEAMTVVDVNTGKFTGKGGNLEETVTRNNLEAAEEIVHQLRLRDIGGIIVIDFIDMVLESNRDLVLRRLMECLGRDRTKHQVAEVTSLGLVQMTRKRVGQGLLESFSEPCEACKARGLVIHAEPVDGSGRSTTVAPVVEVAGPKREAAAQGGAAAASGTASGPSARRGRAARVAQGGPASGAIQDEVGPAAVVGPPEPTTPAEQTTPAEPASPPEPASPAAEVTAPAPGGAPGGEPVVTRRPRRRRVVTRPAGSPVSAAG
ncbi:MAG: Rne/Rng family ribonuclease [Actinobacteria bacterium]|nr:Rne/Rng family ribonuclease [Actinomycetota bacterium]